MRRMRKIETTIPSTFVDVLITFIIMIMENGSNINKKHTFMARGNNCPIYNFLLQVHRMRNFIFKEFR